MKFEIGCKQERYNYFLVFKENRKSVLSFYRSIVQTAEVLHTQLYERKPPYPRFIVNKVCTVEKLEYTSNQSWNKQAMTTYNVCMHGSKVKSLSYL